MKCPFCGDQESKVVDSRHSEDGLSIRRRRECLKCQRRFTTYEIVESLPIIVIKRDGSSQTFDRNKILNSMIRAFDKRKMDVNDLEHITTEIEQTIQNTLEREISSIKLAKWSWSGSSLWTRLLTSVLHPFTTGSRTPAASCGRSASSWKKNNRRLLWIWIWYPCFPAWKV